MNKNKGITLIALVITIIIMLILAGVTLSLVAGSDGLLAKAEKAVSETEKAAMKEDAELAIATIKMEYYEDYATNKAMTTKEFIVAKLDKPYETARGATMEADADGNITYALDGVSTKLTIDENGKVTIGESESEEETTTPVAKYTVTYDANGGTGSVPTDANQYEKGATVTVNFEAVPTKDGSIFLGWATSSDSTEATYISTGTTSFTIGETNVTLYAIWEEESATAGLEVGDSVTYSPSGTYIWGNVNNDAGNTITLSSAEGEKFNITNWKVFSIDEANQKVELVPASSQYSERNVTINGYMGYINGVYYLNEACNELYGNGSTITARSINIEDIESRMTETALAEAHSYTSGTGTKYGEQIKTAYTTTRKYPDIYQNEDLSVIDGKKIEKGEGLGLSEQNGYSAYQNASPEMYASTSLQPYQTYWSKSNSFMQTAFQGDGTGNSNVNYNVFMPNGSDTFYWIASRFVDTESSEKCDFGISSSYGGNVYLGFKLYTDMNADDGTRPLFPVVSVPLELLSGSDNTGWSVAE